MLLFILFKHKVKILWLIPELIFLLYVPILLKEYVLVSGKMDNYVNVYFSINDIG